MKKPTTFKRDQLLILFLFFSCFTLSLSGQEHEIASNEVDSNAYVTDFDTPAYLTKCEGKKNVRECTSKRIMNYVFREIKSRKFIKNSGFYTTEVNFIIGSDGTVSNIQSSGTNTEFNREAERVASVLPSFVPATKDGENVSVKYVLPISMQINK
ncbi:energy transducer TonB [Salinimicrobium sp. GXAS 041]|uniref:energy transducer TonB n=1 Tax=Salinimicrobium sp. GXAS 041 TaxID=3400806 RepID=UPI003C73311C